MKGESMLRAPRRKVVRKLATLLPSILAGCSSVQSRAPAVTAEIYDPSADAWQPAGSPLSAGRRSLTATVLPSGEVVVTGGSGHGYSAGVDVYEHATRTWTPIEALSTARHGHAAVLLADGRLLVTGGYKGDYLEDCQILNTRTWRWTHAAPLGTPRDRHTATLLPGGRILVTGGFTASGATAKVEVYDPKSGAWAYAASMTTPRAYHTATLISGGKVLVAGGENGDRPPPGDNLASAEIYDPQSDTWTRTGSLSVPHAYGQTATLLTDGRVVVVGGEGNSASPQALAVETAEVYDADRGTWRTMAPMPTPRYFHGAVILQSGKLLVAGGYDRNGDPIPLSSSEILEPATGSWRPAASMETARAHHASVLLPDGKVLVIGGDVVP
jgi:N-acetylneuraminic acid mutarotase